MIYYNPEGFGLEIIGDVEWENESYQFNMTGVWKNEQGFWMADDSGCSCPSPFEDHKFPDDFDGPLTFHQVAERLQDGWDNVIPSAKAEVVDLIQRLR